MYSMPGQQTEAYRPTSGVIVSRYPNAASAPAPRHDMLVGRSTSQIVRFKHDVRYVVLAQNQCAADFVGEVLIEQETDRVSRRCRRHMHPQPVPGQG